LRWRRFLLGLHFGFDLPMGRQFCGESMIGIWRRMSFDFEQTLDWLGPWMERWSIDEWPVMMDAFRGRVDVFRLLQRISNH